jgi:putative hydrolase of the HAD superfamily
VLFDAVGTLIYAEPPVHHVYAAAARDFGLAVDETAVKRRFASAFTTCGIGKRGGRENTSEAHERRRWREIIAEVFPDCQQIDELFSRLWDHFAQPASWQLFDDVPGCWRRLRDRGLSIGIASNFDERLAGILPGLPPLGGCNQIFVSSQVGWRKPARQFFRVIEQATSLEPTELLLVGDDWTSDYMGASAAGWQAVFLDRAGERNVPTSIRSLDELL